MIHRFMDYVMGFCAGLALVAVLVLLFAHCGYSEVEMQAQRDRVSLLQRDLDKCYETTASPR